uniref:uncharacterized protein LOC120339217 n=1 Tax=Styela clava TaxID=7725 RepID=UPI00193A0670|nr:uncharacterized protein LOC120339217 [Styela clava]
MEKFEHYVYGRNARVDSNHKPLETITKKPLVDAPKRLQRMLLQLQKYDFVVNYKKGANMFIADTLSRAYINKSTDTIGKSDVFHLSLANEIEEIDMLKDISVLDKTMHVLQKSTEKDSTMRTLRAIIEDGWPITKKQLPRSMQEYFNFREDLTVQNGLILKGCRIVVPESAKQYILQPAPD